MDSATPPDRNLTADLSPAQQGIARPWSALLDFPIHVQAACEGKSVFSLLRERTGLSLAHLSTRGLVVKSPKKVGQVERHASQFLSRLMLSAGVTPEQERDFLSGRPKTPLAGFVYELQLSTTGTTLPLTQGIASSLDALAIAVIDYVRQQELSGYRALLATWVTGQANFLSVDDQDTQFQAATSALSAAQDWDAMRKPTEAIADRAFLSFLAAWDLEWSAGYFGMLVPTPTLHWLLPRFRPGFDPSSASQIERGVVARPIKRLLQLLWMLVKRGTSRQKRWPDGLPGPTELAEDFAVADISDITIRKINAGIRRLDLDKVIDLWCGHCESETGGRCPHPPYLWLVLALWMDRAFVKHAADSSVPGTVIWWDEPLYQRIWAGHRARWAAQLPRPGKEPWPRCLLDQRSGGC